MKINYNFFLLVLLDLGMLIFTKVNNVDWHVATIALLLIYLVIYQRDHLLEFLLVFFAMTAYGLINNNPLIFNNSSMIIIATLSLAVVVVLINFFIEFVKTKK